MKRAKAILFLIIFLAITAINIRDALADDLLGKIESLIKLLDPGEQTDPGVREHSPKKAARGPGRLDQIVHHAAAKFGIDPDLIMSIIQVESGWNPSAISIKGARGLMQLMPDTARRLGVRSIFDPHENIMGGANYYRQMYDTFGNHRQALIAYNCGPQRVMEGRVPSESISYANRVLQVFRARKERRSET